MCSQLKSVIQSHCVYVMQNVVVLVVIVVVVVVDFVYVCVCVNVDTE